VQGRLVGTQPTDLLGTAAARERVARIECGDELTVDELSQPGSIAVHRTTEHILEARTVAIVVTV